MESENRKTQYVHQGRVLRSAREAKRMSQRALARELGLASGQFICNIERGTHPVPVGRILAIAQTLDCDPEAFIQAAAWDYTESYRQKVNALGRLVTGYTTVASELAGADEPTELSA